MRSDGPVQNLFGILAMIAVISYALPVQAVASSASHYIEPPHVMGNHRIGVIQAGLGVACYFDGHIAAPSYAVQDIGKDHVPEVRRADLQMIHSILTHAHPHGLRFTYEGRQFIIFNAPLPITSLCHSYAPFAVWNGACNEYYNPLLGRTEAVTECAHPRRPWIVNDKGIGTAPWSDIVH